ncbi:hypothetical protein [Shinella zoogloeoides]|uniref:hypothetical protein n=1 Tax=Shinella zoogloeoides TaxID=352475 RepID=UPI001F57B265|nr:hypothetical protein [Shinella zoogloeoides]
MRAVLFAFVVPDMGAIVQGFQGFPGFRTGPFEIVSLSVIFLAARPCAPKNLLLHAPPSPQDDTYHDAVVAELVDAQR